MEHDVNAVHSGYPVHLCWRDDCSCYHWLVPFNVVVGFDGKSLWVLMARPMIIKGQKSEMMKRFDKSIAQSLAQE